MQFTYNGLQYEVKESQCCEYTDIYLNGELVKTLYVDDIQNARMSLFPDKFVVAYLAAYREA